MPQRRSSRARTNPPLSATLNQISNHSTSSTSSARGDKTSGSGLRRESSNKSISPRLPSPQDSDTMDRNELRARQTRQKRREQDSQDETELGQAVEEVGDEEGDEEEVTRCVCRRQEYPGPPIAVEEGNRSHKAKDHQAGPIITASDVLPEDAGSLFIQCDDCKVWQHGGCVGIMDEATSPDNYYCEECRKDLHKLLTGVRGQRYSRYLPVFEASLPVTKPIATSPASKESDSRSSRDPEVKIATVPVTAAAAAAAAAALSSAKRRSTMNSRAAMEEEEALRKAIEESKSDGSVVAGGSGSRKGKRVREDSEDTKLDFKRRKTGSDGDSPLDDDMTQVGAESDQEVIGGRMSSSQRKSRGVAAQSQRDRDLREREKERERERAEAAGRRGKRAERRHVDESEPPEEQSRTGITPKAAPPVKAPRVANANKVATSTPMLPHPTNSHKKNAKATARRGRVGRNQYTKDRDPVSESKMDSPRPSHSRDGEEGVNGGDTHGVAFLGNGSKAAKPRTMNPNRTSMTDLRKRAAGILEYISRTQVEMATETASSSNSSSSGSTAIQHVPVSRPALGRMASTNGASKLSRQMEESTDKEEDEREEFKVDEAVFKGLGSRQMMDLLTRQLVHWQKDYGKWGEK